MFLSIQKLWLANDWETELESGICDKCVCVCVNSVNIYTVTR